MMDVKKHAKDRFDPAGSDTIFMSRVKGTEEENENTIFLPYERFRFLLNRALYLALGIHTLFILLFYFRQVYVLALVNVGSVLIYMLNIRLVKQGKDGQAIFLTWLEILGHAAICTLVIGFETGFHYYILVLLPYVFVNASRSTLSKISVSALLFFVYAALVYASETMPPEQILNNSSIEIMRYFNILVCFAMIGAQSHIYSQSVIDGENQLKQINKDLQHAITEVKTLQGILPICSFCKKIRDDKGYWEQVEVYVGDHSHADFSHSICPDCMKINYPEYDEEENYAGNHG
ncbi:MAG: hypothetical protein KKB94_02725 [Proteobacteria bacterium]|nr:hypothetical protein [Pseudomonadota bacterium]